MSKGIFEFNALPPISPGAKFESNEVQMFISKLIGTVRYVAMYNETLTPSSVPANSTSDQTFTIAGLTPTMNVYVVPPSLSSGLGIAYARISANDTLMIRFMNLTAGPLTPASGVYKITAIRQ